MIKLQKQLLEKSDEFAEVKHQTVFLNFEMFEVENFKEILKETYLSAAQLGKQSMLVNTSEESIGYDMTKSYKNFVNLEKQEYTSKNRCAVIISIDFS